MATMGRYCKAYPASVLRTFPGWKEQALPEGVAIPLAPEENESQKEDGASENSASADGAAAGDICLFMQENLVVTGDVFMDEHIVFDEVTPEWTQFCKNVLQFEVPEAELPESDPHPS